MEITYSYRETKEFIEKANREKETVYYMITERSWWCGNDPKIEMFFRVEGQLHKFSHQIDRWKVDWETIRAMLTSANKAIFLGKIGNQ